MLYTVRLVEQPVNFAGFLSTVDDSDWSCDQFTSSLLSPQHFLWGAYLADQSLCAILVALYCQPDHMEILQLLVLPQVRRHGVARSLLRHCQAHAEYQGIKRVLLEVRQTNSQAVALYEACGFAIYGRRSAYYADGSQVYLMQNELISS